MNAVEPMPAMTGTQPFLELINVAEKCLLDCPQVPFETVHRFGPGVYIREVFLPKDTVAVGHYHKTAHMNVMLTGKCTLISSDGERTVLVAPYLYVAEPGRKMAIIHEDVVWLNIHATEETDIDVLEEALLIKSDAYLEAQQRLVEAM